MYKIRNVTSGNLSLDLEQGSVTLSSGQSFDLEPRCSRKWINNATTIRRLITQQYLQLVHDSAVVIPAPRARAAIRVPVTEVFEPVMITSPAVQAPVIVDLSAVEELPVVEKVAPKVVKHPVVEKPIEVVSVVDTVVEEEVAPTKKPDFSWSSSKKDGSKKDSSWSSKKDSKKKKKIEDTE